MEFFKADRVYDFMRFRRFFVGLSLTVVIAALVGLFFPGLNYGIDFAGGTELQLRFGGAIGTAELRRTLEAMGYRNADVIAVTGRANTYIIRVREVTRLPADINKRIQDELKEVLSVGVRNVRVSPGGDKVSIALEGEAPFEAIREGLVRAGLEVRGEVRRFGPESEHRYEADLVGLADQMIQELERRLGERGPKEVERIEWVGPRVGEQLRTSAIRAVVYAIVFIMAYVAFRFDLRFAPGGVIALFHDALFTVLFYVVTQKEFNLTTVAAILTVVGYSINDTIVVYDRIRENLGRYRGKSFAEIINISISQTLGRTIITSGTTILSVLPFLYFGTRAVQDIVLAMVIGFIAGTYSSIYIAAPITEWIDIRFFAPARERLQKELAEKRRKAQATPGASVIRN
ncbi:MAG: protein translocase subunit SecF [Deltaproteobacteria bacterium]|nr:protein translocase subunit SecF [Deltaproteobacteria bacterium]